MVHTITPRSHRHPSHHVIPTLVFRLRGNYCQLSVTRRLQLASRWRLLQITRLSLVIYFLNNWKIMEIPKREMAFDRGRSPSCSAVSSHIFVRRKGPSYLNPFGTLKKHPAGKRFCNRRRREACCHFLVTVWYCCLPCCCRVQVPMGAPCLDEFEAWINGCFVRLDCPAA